METKNETLIDPDPFLLAALSLQSAALILQFVQIWKQFEGVESERRAARDPTNSLERLESALDEFDRAIEKAERMVRRSSQKPDKELYESEFRISVGVLRLSTKKVSEYHNNLAEISNKLSSMAISIGLIIAQHPDIAAKLGQEIVEAIEDAAESLNQLMENGGAIEFVLLEAKRVRDACSKSVLKRLEVDGGNY